MKIEHLAFNVQDPPAVADWYVENLGMKIVKAGDPPISVRFLADDGGNMIEIYHNDAAPMTDYSTQDPLTLHLAFLADDCAATRDRLLQAGATSAGDMFEVGGDILAMLRDPWGFAIQLAQRQTPLC